MLIKIGYNWFTVLPGQPILIQFEMQELEQIKAMIESNRNTYCKFATVDALYPTDEEKKQWILGEATDAKGFERIMPQELAPEQTAEKPKTRRKKKV